MRSNWRICLALIVVSLLTACALPAPTRSPLQVPSPLNTPGPAGKIVAFRLNKPIVEGVDKVSGTGPAGVPIMLMDATFAGTVLGTTTIGSDGQFVIKTPVLEKNHRVGLVLGNLAGTRWKPEDFYALEYRGDDAMQLPQIGFFYDTAMVQAK